MKLQHNRILFVGSDLASCTAKHGFQKSTLGKGVLGHNLFFAMTRHYRDTSVCNKRVKYRQGGASFVGFAVSAQGAPEAPTPPTVRAVRVEVLSLSRPLSRTNGAHQILVLVVGDVAVSS